MKTNTNLFSRILGLTFIFCLIFIKVDKVQANDCTSADIRYDVYYHYNGCQGDVFYPNITDYGNTIDSFRLSVVGGDPYNDIQNFDVSSGQFDVDPNYIGTLDFRLQVIAYSDSCTDTSYSQHWVEVRPFVYTLFVPNYGDVGQYYSQDLHVQAGDTIFEMYDHSYWSNVITDYAWVWYVSGVNSSDFEINNQFIYAGTEADTIYVQYQNNCSYVEFNIIVEVPEETCVDTVLTQATICSGDAYNFYGNEYNHKGTYDTLIANGNACSTFNRLELSVTEFNYELNYTQYDVCSYDMVSPYFYDRNKNIDSIIFELNNLYGSDSLIAFDEHSGEIVFGDSTGSYYYLEITAIAYSNGCADTTNLYASFNVKAPVREIYFPKYDQYVSDWYYNNVLEVHVGDTIRSLRSFPHEYDYPLEELSWTHNANQSSGFKITSDYIYVGAEEDTVHIEFYDECGWNYFTMIVLDTVTVEEPCSIVTYQYDSTCAGSEYYFGDTVLTSPGVYEYAYHSNSTGCDSVFVLDLMFYDVDAATMTWDSLVSCGTTLIYPEISNGKQSQLFNFWLKNGNDFDEITLGRTGVIKLGNTVPGTYNLKIQTREYVGYCSIYKDYDVSVTIEVDAEGQGLTYRHYNDSIVYFSGDTINMCFDDYWVLPEDKYGNAVRWTQSSTLGLDGNFWKSNSGSLSAGNIEDTLFLTTTNHCETNEYVVIIEDCDKEEGVSTAVLDIHELEVNVYPNPSNGIVNIEATQAGMIQVVNFVGQTIQQEMIQEGINTLDLQAFTKGVYFINIELETETITKRIIIQ